MEQFSSPADDTVQFSRTQGIFSAIALGGSIVVGLSTFVAGLELIEQSGSDAPLVFGIASILFLPILLSCVQRSSSIISSASFYGSAKATGSTLQLFFTVWLMLGGYLTLAALLAYGTASRIDLALDRFFGFKIGIQAALILILAVVFLKEFITQKESWRSRTIVFWSCIAFLITLTIWAMVAQTRAGVSIPKTLPTQHWLLPVSMLASSLWGIDVVLNYRGQFRRPTRTLTWGLIGIYWGTGIFCSLVTIVTLRNPAVLMQNWLSVLTWKESRLELLILLAGFLICASGLLRVMTRVTRLLGSMSIDGAIPFIRKEGAESGIHYYFAFLCALIVYLADTFSVRYLLSISAFAALLALVVYLYPLLKKDVSRIAGISLPLHPLVPAVAILLSIFLMWILPLSDLFIGALWMFAGFLLYVAYSRKKMLPAMQQQHVLAVEGTQRGTPQYRVLACLSGEQLHESLVRIGSLIASAKNGELLVLRILETSEQIPAFLQRKRGELEWAQLRHQLDSLTLPGITVPVVRIAPDVQSGFRATAREFNADFLLLEWPEEPVERLRTNRLQNLLQLTARPLAILKGDILDRPGKISVACGRSAHSILALQMCEVVATTTESAMEAIRIFTKTESKQEAMDGVKGVIQRSGIQTSPKLVLYESKDVVEAILKETEAADLLLIGASDDPLSGRPLPDGQSILIAQQRKAATLIVKSKEEPSSFLLRRMLAILTSRIASMTPREKSELLGQLKVGLQARADFYLMVALAAAIAITGLIMDDGSIVLGAMLVSPLMSPIVGIACGIALGNLDLMRRSGASTFKGMGVVFGVGVVMTFLLPSVEPTHQILVRTHPGIFDLLAALAAGAAGAYSLGRKSVAGALPGVAMSLSLEPPLATAGYGLSTSQFWIMGGAFLLFVTNLAAIVLSGVGVYLLLGMRPPRREGMSIVGKSVASVILVVLILIVPLGFGTYGSLQKGHLKYQIESEFRTEALSEHFELLDLKISEQDDAFLIHPTVLASEEVTPEKLEKFRKAVEQKTGSRIQIEATVLQTRRVDSPANTKENGPSK